MFKSCHYIVCNSNFKFIFTLQKVIIYFKTLLKIYFNELFASIFNASF